jgi:hypothetical protein
MSEYVHPCVGESKWLECCNVAYYGKNIPWPLIVEEFIGVALIGSQDSPCTTNIYDIE